MPGLGQGNLKEEEAEQGHEVEGSFHLQVFDSKMWETRACGCQNT